ncbi:MAG: V-type ATP synthase subunit E family protein [Sarcina ventriculi]|uniref:V-type ATP synthase subunit E n=2 Tax=Sarcina TaxID=1266 RepID=A0ACD1BDQ9_9CLOT|nr:MULTISPECIES: V-type ATP synthase subunit E family protein [Sarcina]MDO4402983.1 V-type ATP synthase subunit E family protein [Clostridiaceae bacterium]MBU5321843.1 V-type ATP synthase subunit E [Sarcina ventriculi]MCI5635518.1 V-type ATP synthase subunit E family protein [Sarcina ventriculi]MDD7372978.1 V-type ATP synthase subunit E family protein [Sarcina ventriculi]MDY7063323.1 V-type ATP synthase subunit E family protein [Sarcina ventriculi]
MSNLNNITSKIIKDAEEKRDEILNAAQVESDSIIAKETKKAKNLEVELIEKAKIEAKARENRVISNARLKVRNNELKAKQDMISKVFEKAVERLNSLSTLEYKEYILRALDSLDLEGTEILIINKKDEDVINNKFLLDLNNKLISLGKKGKISILTNGNFDRGFILDRNGIQINNTFESLVKSLRSELELEVTKVLFN